jgi:hypothetical protein
MAELGLTKTERLLLYGLKMFKVTKEDAAAIMAFLEEDDHILMIHYLKTHTNATPQDILNESGRILKQRKRLTK